MSQVSSQDLSQETKFVPEKSILEKALIKVFSSMSDADLEEFAKKIFNNNNDNNNNTFSRTTLELWVVDEQKRKLLIRKLGKPARKAILKHLDFTEEQLKRVNQEALENLIYDYFSYRQKSLADLKKDLQEKQLKLAGKNTLDTLREIAKEYLITEALKKQNEQKARKEQNKNETKEINSTPEKEKKPKRKKSLSDAEKKIAQCRQDIQRETSTIQTLEKEIQELLEKEREFVQNRQYLEAHERYLQGLDKEAKKDQLKKRIAELKEVEISYEQQIREEKETRKKLKTDFKLDPEVTADLLPEAYFNDEKPDTARERAWKHFFGDDPSGLCPICMRTEVSIASYNFHAAHIIPESRNGPKKSWNLVPTCASCNSNCTTNNLIDWVGTDPVKRHRLRDVVLKKYIGHCNKKCPSPTTETLVKYVVQVFRVEKLDQYKYFFSN